MTYSHRSISPIFLSILQRNNLRLPSFHSHMELEALPLQLSTQTHSEQLRDQAL
jgi:hypothetical protein